MKSFLSLIYVAMQLVLISTSCGAESENSLLKFLSLVPDTELSRQQPADRSCLELRTVSYVDYRAIESGRRNPVRPADYEQFNALDRDSLAVWSAAFGRLATGPEDFYKYSFRIFGDHLPDSVGFDFFEVHMALLYGGRQSAVEIFAGDFDQDAVEKAFTKRDYARHEIGDYSLWRRADGKPDDETQEKFPEEKLDPATFKRIGAERHKATPWGGKLGRKQPLVVISEAQSDTSFLASSVDWDELVRIARTAGGEQNSLADADDYRTLAEAITSRRNSLESPILVQAQFMSLDEDLEENYLSRYLLANARFLGDTMDLRVLLKSDAARVFCHYGPLPFSSLAVIADLQEGNETITAVALYYPDFQDAEKAAKELARRIPAYSFSLNGTAASGTLMSAIEGAYAEDAYVYRSKKTGHAAAIMAIRAPLPPDERRADSGHIPIAGDLFRQWMSVFRWLSFSPIHEINLEAAAKGVGLTRDEICK